MNTSWLVGSLHLLALGIGLGSVWARGRALRGALDAAGIASVMVADRWWAVAGALWLVTGLLRAFAGLEKGTDYYVANHLFLAKLGLFVVVLGLEVLPIVTLGRWRAAQRRGQAPDTSTASRLATISTLQAAIVVTIVFMAWGIARGYGVRAD